MSLALAHKRRILALGVAGAAAAVAAASLAYSPGEALSSPANARKHLALMEASLDQDLARLSDMSGRNAARQDLKRDELLPKYDDYIQRYLESGLVFPNRVLVHVVIWLFDTAQLDDALALADIAIEQKQVMPEDFKRRDIQTFVADAVYERPTTNTRRAAARSHTCRTWCTASTASGTCRSRSRPSTTS